MTPSHSRRFIDRSSGLSRRFVRGMLITHQQKRQRCPERENLQVVHLAPIRLSTLGRFEFASAVRLFLFYFDSQGLSLEFLGELRTIVGTCD